MLYSQGMRAGGPHACMCPSSSYISFQAQFRHHLLYEVFPSDLVEISLHTSPRHLTLILAFAHNSEAGITSAPTKPVFQVPHVACGLSWLFFSSSLTGKLVQRRLTLDRLRDCLAPGSERESLSEKTLIGQFGSHVRL